MATGRMLNKSISIDPDFNQMSVDARELFMKVIPHLDRDGLIAGHPSKLWATIDPFHADRLQRMGEHIQEWIDANLVTRYNTGKGPVLFFHGFRKNNSGIRYDREQRSVYPPPPGWRRTAAGLVPDDPDLRHALIDQYDRRSDYRDVLQEYEEYPDPIRSHSRHDPELLPLEDQDQDQDVVVDQTTDHHHLVCEVGGSAEGGEITHLLQFPVAALIEAARQLGPLLFGPDWQGDYEDYITTANESQLTVLVEWLYHLNTSDYQSYESINNLPAFVRKCVSRGSRPQLPTKRRQEMFAQVRKLSRQRSEGWEL